MSLLPKIDSNTPSPPKRENLITEKLSPELLNKMFSYLDRSDIQSASLVSRTWNAIARDSASHKELRLIKAFVEFVCRQLDREVHSAQIAAIRNTVDVSIVKNDTLTQIKSSVLATKEKIIKVLEELDHEKLLELKKTGVKNTPLLFDDIFDQTILNKKLYIARQRTDEAAREMDLLDIFLHWLLLKNFDKANEVAHEIPNEKLKNAALSDISSLEGTRPTQPHLVNTVMHKGKNSLSISR